VQFRFSDGREASLLAKREARPGNDEPNSPSGASSDTMERNQFSVLKGMPSMSLTVDLTSDEVDQIKRITRVEDDAAAVTKAAREYLRLSRLRELKAISGKVDYDDNSTQLESLELDEMGFPQL
jgi:hypothetical protein